MRPLSWSKSSICRSYVGYRLAGWACTNKKKNPNMYDYLRKNLASRAGIKSAQNRLGRNQWVSLYLWFTNCHHERQILDPLRVFVPVPRRRAMQPVLVSESVLIAIRSSLVRTLLHCHFL